MINWLIENWATIVGVLVIIAVGGFAIYKFAKLPYNKQVGKVKEWLLYACVQAEKELGSGTGTIKLRLVYDGFVSKFKFISIIMSFETFSSMVDEALKKMQEILKKNNSVKELIGLEETTPATPTIQDVITQLSTIAATAAETTTV